MREQTTGNTCLLHMCSILVEIRISPPTTTMTGLKHILMKFENLVVRPGLELMKTMFKACFCHMAAMNLDKNHLYLGVSQFSSSKRDKHHILSNLSLVRFITPSKATIPNTPN